MRESLSGLSREAYIRQLINSIVPNEAPPDYHHMAEVLHKVGNDLNQIACKAHTMNVIDVKRYDEAVCQFKKMVLLITQSVIKLPLE